MNKYQEKLYKVNNKPPFRVICIDDDCCGELVEGRRYIVTKEIDDRYVLFFQKVNILHAILNVFNTQYVERR